MDIPALSIVKNQMQLQQDVSLALMKKVMETAEERSSLVNEMLNKIAAGNLPYLGSQVDVYV